MKISLARAVSTAEDRVISGVIVAEYNRPGRHRGKFLLGLAVITDTQNNKYERAFSSQLDDPDQIVTNLMRDNLKHWKSKFRGVKKVDVIYYEESVSNDRLRELKRVITAGHKDIYSPYGKHGN